uniref:S4 RNA-binding domain-containing protein n=1 Tax=Rhabditophanes sp. KR3021 TaxID=114890 RepID=A0AC35TPA9_9BILA
MPYSNFVVQLSQSNETTNVFSTNIIRHAHKKPKKEVIEAITQFNEQQEEEDEIDDGLPIDYKVKTFGIGSRRLDTLLNRAAGKSSSETEKLILSGKVRLNGEKANKKAYNVHKNDEIDIFLCPYPDNSELAEILRLNIKDYTLTPNGYAITCKNKDEKTIPGMSKPGNEPFSVTYKRAFDSIDGNGFADLKKRAFDSIDADGFHGFDKRAFDSIDGIGFHGLDKRAFDSIDADGFHGFDKRAFDSIDADGFTNLKKRAFDSIDADSFHAFDKRAFDVIDADGFHGLDKRAFDSIDADGFVNLKKRAFDSIDGDGFHSFDKRAFDAIDADGFHGLDKRVPIYAVHKRAFDTIDGFGFEGLDKRSYDIYARKHSSERSNYEKDLRGFDKREITPRYIINQPFLRGRTFLVRRLYH